MAHSLLLLRGKGWFSQKMFTQPRHLGSRKTGGYALGEVLIAIGLLALVFAGLIYGYGQTNRMAEWSSMSLAAQSYAQQGAEQVRAAVWDPRNNITNTNGPNTPDELPAPSITTNIDFMDVPMQGNPSTNNTAFQITNFVYVTAISGNPPLRQIRSDCVWKFPLTGLLQTNSVILLRTADQ